MIGTVLRRWTLRALAAPATLRAVLAARSVAARAGREAAFLAYLRMILARIGRWVDPTPLRAETNFHADRIADLAGRPPIVRAPRRPRRATGGGALRVATYGQFSGALSFGPKFFSAVPNNIELTIVDVSWRGVWADALAGLVHRYIRLEDSADGALDAAEKVNALDLDVFCNIRTKSDPRFLAALDAPCVVNWMGGSVPIHGDVFDFQLCAQYQRNYILADRRLVHRRTGVPVPDVALYPSVWPYDPREGVVPESTPAARRGQDIFFHGSLYKLADRDYLDLLFRVMADLPSTRLRFMAKRGSRGELALIDDRARAWGVADRVVRLDGYDNMRDRDSGEVSDERWQLCRRELGRARLWLGTYPGVGASARVEAYMAGAPVAQMGFPAGWRDGSAPIHNAWELPHLRVEIGTATTPAAYEALMRRILLDDRFAQSVADAQSEKLPEILDQGGVWRSLRDAYADWASRGHA